MLSERQIEIRFIEEAVTATARLLSADAPKTCEAFWKALNEPMTVQGVHAMWTGPEVSCSLVGENRRFDGAALPKENLTSFPQPGDLVWSYVPAYAWPGVHAPIYDLGIYYGREARTLFPIGWFPGNRFAVIDDGLEALASICRRTQIEGAKTLRISRLT